MGYLSEAEDIKIAERPRPRVDLSAWLYERACLPLDLQDGGTAPSSANDASETGHTLGQQDDARSHKHGQGDPRAMSA
jgi:hypothetical protein